MKRAHCPRCKQEVDFYQDNPPKLIDCPRCGLDNLIVREAKEACPICHGAGSTTDNHDPCSNCGVKGYITGEAK